MPGISSREEWQDWQRGGRQPVAGDSPSVQQIPPMLRRRLSPLGKMALSVAWPLLAEGDSMPSVFCSRHGELERTAGMLQNLARGEALSPTHFSLSVHNAIGGVFSIARGDTSALTALAVGVEDMSQALLETRLILAEQQSAEALCLIYDAPLPEVYSEFGNYPQWPYAAAFVVGPPGPADASEPALSVERCAAEDLPPSADRPEAPDEPQALAFIRFLLAGPRRDLYLPSRRDYWRWAESGEQA